MKTTKISVFVFITEIFWPIFWRNNCWSISDVVEKLCYWVSINRERLLKMFKSMECQFSHIFFVWLWRYTVFDLGLVSGSYFTISTFFAFFAFIAPTASTKTTTEAANKKEEKNYSYKGNHHIPCDLNSTFQNSLVKR